MRWYKHNGFLNGTTNWADPIGGIEVGTGWGDFKSVFATSGGVIYAIQPDGKLRWYKHNGWMDGTASWADPGGGLELGTAGWADFNSVFASRDGIIYAVQPDGSLFWYYHQGWNNGAVSWGRPCTSRNRLAAIYVCLCH